MLPGRASTLLVPVPGSTSAREPFTKGARDAERRRKGCLKLGSTRVCQYWRELFERVRDVGTQPHGRADGNWVHFDVGSGCAVVVWGMAREDARAASRRVCRGDAEQPSARRFAFDSQRVPRSLPR